MRAFQTHASANFQKAALVLNKALALDPNNLVIHERLASIYEQQGNARSAAERMQFVAQTARRSGDNSLLEKALLKLVTLLPDDPDVLQHLVHFRTKQGQIKEAVSLMETLLAVYERQGALEKAASTCEQILALNPQRSDVREKLIQIQEKKGSQKEVLAERRVLADSLLEKGNSQEALQQYRLILSAEPDDAIALERMAELSDRIGLKEQSHDGYTRLAVLSSDPKQSLVWYQKAVHAFSTNPRTWQNLGDIANSLGQKDEAVAAYEQASQLFLESSEPVLAEKCLRQIRQLAPDAQRSRETLIRLLKSQGKRGESLEEILDLAGILRARGETAEACRLYQEAHADNPSSLAAAFQLGELYQETGQTQAFCQLYENLAAQRSSEGDLEGAVDLYQRLLAVDSENADALQALASTLRAMGKNNDAVLKTRQLAEVLCTQAKDAADTIKNLLLARARQCLWDALEWAPDDADLHCQMAAVESLRGEREQAARILADFCRRSLLKFQSEETQTGDVAARETFGKILAQAESSVGASALIYEVRSEIHAAFGESQKAAECLLTAGDTHQEHGDLAAALTAFENARLLIPDSDAPLLRILSVSRKRGETNAAVTAAWQLAKRFRDRSQNDDLERILAEIAELVPSDARVHEWRVLNALENKDNQAALERTLAGADALVEQKQYQETIVLCRSTREKIGANPLLSEKIIECLIQRQDIRGAIAEATDLATFYQGEGSSDEAITVYQRAISWEPRNTVLRKAMAELCFTSGKPDDAKREWLELVTLYTQSGLAEKAVEVLRDLKYRFTDDRAIRHQLVQLLLKEGMARSAAQEGSSLLNEIWEQIPVSKGKAHEALLQEARQLAEQVLTANPDLGDTIAVYAEVLFLMKDEPSYVTQKIRQTTLLRESSDYVSAATCLQEALERIPNNEILQQTLDQIQAESTRASQQISFADRLKKADKLLAADKAEEAIASCEGLLAEAPGNPDVMQCLARAYGKAGKREEMVSTYLGIADLYREKRATTQASRILSTLLELEPTSAPALERLAQMEKETAPSKAVESFLALGNVLRQQGDLTKASEAFREVLTLRRENAVALQTLGEVLWEQTQSSAAQGALSLDSAHKALEAIGYLESATRVLTTRGHQDEAVQLCLSLLSKAQWLSAQSESEDAPWVAVRTEARQKETAVRAFLTPLLRSLGRETEAIEIDMAAAQSLLEAEQLDGAESALERILSSNPHEIQARQLIIEVLTQQFQKEQAQTQDQSMYTGSVLMMRTPSETEMEIQRRIVEHRSALATLYLDTGDSTQAIQQYEMLLQVSPSAGGAREKLISLYLERGEMEKGVAQLRSLANTYREKGLLGSVLEIYLRALDIDPSNHDLAIELAKVYAEQGLTDRAIRLLRRISDTEWAKGELSQATETLKQAVEIEPTNVTLLGKLSKGLLTLGDLETAREAYTSLMEVYCERGLFARAAQLLDKDLQEFPAAAELWRNLARVWQKRKHPEQAFALLEKLQKVAPSIETQRQIDFLKGQEQKTPLQAAKKPLSQPSTRVPLSPATPSRFPESSKPAQQRSSQTADDLFAQAKVSFEHRRYPTVLTQLQSLMEKGGHEFRPNEKMEIYNLMGMCHFHLKEFESAIGMFNKAAEIPEPDTNLLKEVRYNVALALEEQGNIEGAVEIWKEIYALDPAFRDIRTKILSTHLRKKKR